MLARCPTTPPFLSQDNVYQKTVYWQPRSSLAILGTISSEKFTVPISDACYIHLLENSAVEFGRRGFRDPQRLPLPATGTTDSTLGQPQSSWGQE